MIMRYSGLPYAIEINRLSQMGFKKRRVKLLTEAKVYPENGSKAEKNKHQDATRHTFGTYLYAKTEDIDTVTFRMGNSSKEYFSTITGELPQQKKKRLNISAYDRKLMAPS